MKNWFDNTPIISVVMGIIIALKSLAEKHLETLEKMEKTKATADQIVEVWDPKIPAEPPKIEGPQPPPPAKKEPPVPNPVAPAKADPTAPKKVLTLIQHSMRGCAPCAVDKRQVLPIWRAKGYNIVEIDEGFGIPGSRYPWYEIYDKDGNQRVHVGSLPRTTP